MNIETHMDAARQLAAQCWCDEETKDRVMDPALCEAFAKRIAGLVEMTTRHCRHEQFYRGICEQSLSHIVPSPIDTFHVKQLPDLVASLAKIGEEWLKSRSEQPLPEGVHVGTDPVTGEPQLLVEVKIQPKLPSNGFVLKAEDIHDDLQIDCDEFFGDG